MFVACLLLNKKALKVLRHSCFLLEIASCHTTAYTLLLVVNFFRGTKVLLYVTNLGQKIPVLTVTWGELLLYGGLLKRKYYTCLNLNEKIDIHVYVSKMQ